MEQISFRNNVYMLTENIKIRLENSYAGSCAVERHIGPDIAVIHILYSRGSDMPKTAKSIARHLKKYFSKVEVYKEESQKSSQIDIVIWR